MIEAPGKFGSAVVGYTGLLPWIFSGTNERVGRTSNVSAGKLSGSLTGAFQEPSPRGLRITTTAAACFQQASLLEIRILGRNGI